MTTITIKRAGKRPVTRKLDTAAIRAEQERIGREMAQAEQAKHVEAPKPVEAPKGTVPPDFALLLSAAKGAEMVMEHVRLNDGELCAALALVARKGRELGESLKRARARSCSREKRNGPRRSRFRYITFRAEQPYR